MNCPEVTLPFSMLQLAQAFSARLRHELGADLAEVIRRNCNEINPEVCHSHDFVDANETMMGALQAVLAAHKVEQSEEVLLEHISTFDEYRRMWDAAWRLARAHHFTL